MNTVIIYAEEEYILISKEDAYQILNEKLTDKRRIVHSRIVSVMMAKLAERIGKDQMAYSLLDIRLLIQLRDFL